MIQHGGEITVDRIAVEAVTIAATTVSPEDPFNPLRRVLERWFYKPDLQAIRIAMGTIKSHYLNIGTPAWLFVVAPPGSGKTTMTIMSACRLQEVQALGDVTENTFLSGFHGHKEPGLLEKLGPTMQDGNTYTTNGNAVFLIKDFTTVLSMKRDKRSVILSQLREIHEGQFRRDFGTGVTKIWNGRVSIVAAVTPVLDRHYSIFSTLGERFMQVRWHRTDEEAGEWAIKQQGRGEEIRAELGAAVKGIFDASRNDEIKLPPTMRTRLASLSEIVALARTHVYRNGYGSRDIEHVPEAEANYRLSQGLSAIAKGVAALNQRNEVAEADLQDAFRVGMDCISDARRHLLLWPSFAAPTLTSFPFPELYGTGSWRNWRPLALLSLKLVGGLPSVLKCYCVLRGFDDYLSRSVPVYPKGKLNKQQPHREDTSGKADEVC